PRDIDMPLEERLDLTLIVGVEHDVDRASILREEIADDVPDLRDLRIVEHGPDDDRIHSRPLHPLSENGYAADRLADELVERVRHRRHDCRRAAVAEIAVQADVLPERRAPAHTHA